jgi:hypothetical protein
MASSARTLKEFNIELAPREALAVWVAALRPMLLQQTRLLQ